MSGGCLRLCQIAKSFPAAHKSAAVHHVLTDVSAEFHTGKIHTILGENGSGKSTLMDILSGAQQPSGGSILIDDLPVTFSCPADALKSGIAIVHQNPILPEHFSIADACKATGQKIEAAVLLIERCSFSLNPDEQIASCPALQRVQTAIICAVLHSPRFLILDEPGAILSAEERAGIYRLLHTLTEQGTGIILISHHPQEAAGESDYTAVLENGMLRPFDWESDRDFYRVTIEYDKQSVTTDKAALVLRDIAIHQAEKDTINGISLSVCAGEICTLTGDRQDGLSSLEEILTGFARPTSGTALINGTRILRFTPAEIRAAGAGIVPSKKTAKAAAQNMTIYETLGTPLLHSSARVITPGMLRRHAVQLLTAEKFELSPNMPTTALSGGMHQRLILLREMETRPPLLILADPLQGLDRKSRARFCMIIASAAASGTAVVILTPDAESTASISTVTRRFYRGNLI